MPQSTLSGNNLIKKERREYLQCTDYFWGKLCEICQSSQYFWAWFSLDLKINPKPQGWNTTMARFITPGK